MRGGSVGRTYKLAASFAEGKTTLLAVNSSGLDALKLADGKTAVHTSLVEIPLLQRLETVLMIALVGSAYLVILGVSIRRSRRWPVRVEFEGRQAALANWKLRVGAFLFDSALFSFVAFVALFDTNANWTDQFLSVLLGTDSLTTTLLLLLWVLYFILLENQHGQTLGKWLFGIAVVTTDLRVPGLRHVVVRNLVRLIEPAVFGLVVALNVKTCQRLGDLFAGTLVIRLPKKAAAGSAPEESS